MKVTSVNWSLQALEFIALSAAVMPVQDGYIDLPHSALTQDLQKGFERMHLELFGCPLGEAEATANYIRIRVSGGRAKKLYGPAVYQHPTLPDTIAIRWGNAYYPLAIEKSGFVLSDMLTGELAQVKMGYTEDCLVLTLSSDDDKIGDFVLPLTLKPKDWEAPFGEAGVNELKALLRKGKSADIYNRLAKPVEPGAGGGLSRGGTIYDLRTVMAGRYLCTKYRSCNAGGRHSNIFTLEPIEILPGPDDTEANGVVYSFEGPQQVWGRPDLNAAAFAHIQTPFELTMLKQLKDNGKWRIDFELVGTYAEQTVDLSFLN